MQPNQKQTLKKKAAEIFLRLHELNPNPTTELEYRNNYTLLVAIILSAQATDKGVNKATKALFLVADSSEKMLALGEEKLKNYIKTIGLFNSKARNIMLMSQMLVDKFNNNIPTTFTELIELPGVGRKTANVYLHCALGEPTIAVDTHVLRVSNRLGLVKTKNPTQCEKQLLGTIPPHWLKYAHHLLILHGRYICKARKPDCANCPVNNLCDYFAFLGKP